LYPITGSTDGDAGPSDGGPGDGGLDDGGPGDGGPSDGGPGDGGEPLPACATATAQPGDSTHSLLVGGVSRSYVLHVPSAYDGASPAPLVVDFHAVGGSGMDQLATSPYPTHLDPEGVVMAFPEGLRGPAGTAWNVGPCCVEDADDVAFARALVADVGRRACVDPARVYAVGVLTGGGMAHYLGCHAADLFAAIAPAAFDLLQENVGDCVPARPIGVVSFRGTGESRVPYEGGPSSAVPGMPLTFLGAKATFDAWGRINGCDETPSPEDARGCASYPGCEGGVDIMLCTQQGASEEPGDPEIAWPVLARHAL
jgi:polyhydroxybutyrate depolymerase